MRVLFRGSHSIVISHKSQSHSKMISDSRTRTALLAMSITHRRHLISARASPATRDFVKEVSREGCL